MAKHYVLSVGYHHVRSDKVHRKEFPGMIRGSQAADTTVTLLQELMKRMRPLKGQRPRDPVFMIKATKLVPATGSDDLETFEAAMDWIMENFERKS